MTKQVKIIYEDCKSDIGTIVPKLTWALVPFGSLNSPYSDSTSYADNFEHFVQDSFESGFLYLDANEAIPIFQVKKFLAHNPPDPTNNQNPSKKKAKKKQTRKRMPKQKGNQNNGQKNKTT